MNNTLFILQDLDRIFRTDASGNCECFCLVKYHFYLPALMKHLSLFCANPFQDAKVSTSLSNTNHPSMTPAHCDITAR